MKLGLKIILPILLLLVIVTGAFCYILYNLQQQETIISSEGAKIRTLNGLNERLARQQEQTEYNVLAYRFNQDRTLLFAISQAELDKSKTLDEMYPFITSERGRELINSYIDSRKEVESLRTELIQAIDEGDEEQITLNYNKWNIQTQNIKAALSDIGAYNINSLEKTLATIGDIKNKIFEIIIILVFVVIAIILFLFLYLRSVITNPIIKLAQFAEEVASKNFTTTTTTTTTRKDELGILSRAFNTMVEKLKESYTTLEQKVGQRTAKLAEKTQDAENSKKAALNILEDLKIQEQKLAEAMAKDEAMLASIGEGVIGVDADGEIMLMNKSAQDMLGWHLKDIAGKMLFDAVPIEDENGNLIPREKRPGYFALKGTTATSHTYNYLRKDKTKFPVALKVSPVVIDNKIVGAIEVFRDITKEKEIDKAKTEFVSLASHQLRTPLTAIKWYSEMLLDGDAGELSGEQKKYLAEISGGNVRMIGLVNALLDVSRIELGTFSVEPTPTDVVALIKDVVKEMEPDILKKKLGVEEDYAKDLPAINLDPRLIRMVFQNLLSNAVKYTPPEGQIALAVKAEGLELHIRVSDTGVGIPKDQHDKIFTKFFRADNVQEIDTTGTGLGLYIVKAIMEHSGGRVWFESAKNKGSMFYVTLPIHGMTAKVGTRQLGE